MTVQPSPTRQGLRALVAASLVALAGGCATAAHRLHAAAPAESPGAAFAERACAGCHAVSRHGASRNPHAPAFRNLASARTDAELAVALEKIARVGHIEMPPIGITPQEQVDLVRYMRSLRGKQT